MVNGVISSFYVEEVFRLVTRFKTEQVDVVSTFLQAVILPICLLFVRKVIILVRYDAGVSRSVMLNLIEQAVSKLTCLREVIYLIFELCNLILIVVFNELANASEVRGNADHDSENNSEKSRK